MPQGAEAYLQGLILKGCQNQLPQWCGLGPVALGPGWAPGLILEVLLTRITHFAYTGLTRIPHHISGESIRPDLPRQHRPVSGKIFVRLVRERSLRNFVCFGRVVFSSPLQSRCPHSTAEGLGRRCRLEPCRRRVHKALWAETRRASSLLIRGSAWCKKPK